MNRSLLYIISTMFFYSSCSKNLTRYDKAYNFVVNDMRSDNVFEEYEKYMLENNSINVKFKLFLSDTLYVYGIGNKYMEDPFGEKLSVFRKTLDGVYNKELSKISKKYYDYSNLSREELILPKTMTLKKLETFKGFTRMVFFTEILNDSMRIEVKGNSNDIFSSNKGYEKGYIQKYLLVFNKKNNIIHSERRVLDH